MKIHPLAGPELLHPVWFAKVRHGQHPSVVAKGGTVTLQGVVLRMSVNAPAPGTAVQVWLSESGFFVCATLDEIERETLTRRAAEAANAAQTRQKLNAMRSDAEAFNARIALPVKWDVGIKDALSGLRENSWGDGRSKATVEHIYLLGALDEGRLKRTAGDFLCTSSSGSNGKRWSARIVERFHDAEGIPFSPKVTCKKCIVLAQRWARSST